MAVALKFVLPEKEEEVTLRGDSVEPRRSIQEYVQELLYLRVSREEKGKMFDEFTQVMVLHRNAAIRLLNRPNQPGDNAVGRLNMAQWHRKRSGFSGRPVTGYTPTNCNPLYQTIRYR